MTRASSRGSSWTARWTFLRRRGGRMTPRSRRNAQAERELPTLACIMQFCRPATCAWAQMPHLEKRLIRCTFAKFLFARKLSLYAERNTPRIDAFETPALAETAGGFFFASSRGGARPVAAERVNRDSGSIARGALALLGSGARANLFTRRAARPAPAAGGDHARIARLFLPGSRGPWLERRRFLRQSHVFPPKISGLSSDNSTPQVDPSIWAPRRRVLGKKTTICQPTIRLSVRAFRKSEVGESRAVADAKFGNWRCLMRAFLNRSTAAALTALFLGLGVAAATTTPADAAWRHGGCYGGWWGPALGLGVLGLAAGPYYYGGYYGPGPYYGYGYGPYYGRPLLRRWIRGRPKRLHRTSSGLRPCGPLPRPPLGRRLPISRLSGSVSSACGFFSSGDR